MTIGRPVPLADRGDIFSVNLDPTLGSEQAGTRPSVVISPAFMNASGTLIVAPMTTKKLDRVREWEARVPAGSSGIDEDSKVKLDQLRTISSQRLIRRIGRVPPECMPEIDSGLLVALGLEGRAA